MNLSFYITRSFRGSLACAFLLFVLPVVSSAQIIPVCGSTCWPPPNKYRWCQGVQQVVPITYDASIDEWGNRGEAVRTAIDGGLFGEPNAIEEWNFVTDFGGCIPVYLEAYSGEPLPGDVVIKMRDFLSEPFPPEDDIDPMDYAVTVTGEGVCRNITGAEIYFNARWRWEDSPTLSLSTALHEVGHALGIAHDVCSGCQLTLMAEDPPSTHTSVDGAAKRALETIYGNLCNSVCGLTRNFIDVSPAAVPGTIDFGLGGWDGCVRNCTCPVPEGVQARSARRSTYRGTRHGSVEKTLPNRVLQPRTYELAVRETTGTFVPFTTIGDSVWNSGSYTHSFPAGLRRAVFRARVYDGTSLVEETFSWPSITIQPTAVDVRGSFLRDRVVDIVGVMPNPAHNGLRVMFALVDNTPATLEMVDVMGRRVASLEVGSFGPGRHEVAMAPGQRTRAGMYFLVLRQSGGIAKNRVIWLE